MHLNLENKVFFIAGSSQGIGLGIAESFLKEGSSVVITGRNQEKLKNTFSELSHKYDKKKILALSGDMGNLETIRNNFSLASKKFGEIDGIIANIGSGLEPLGISNVLDIWDISFHKNLKTSILFSQESLPYLNPKAASILFISSIAGIEDIKAPLAYSVHKAGIIAASKKLSRELAQKNIRVNVIAPGNVIFPGGNWEKKKNQDPEETSKYINNEVPLNCFGTPEDIGNICLFLSSEKAKFISGSLIVVDGGQTRSF